MIKLKLHYHEATSRLAQFDSTEPQIHSDWDNENLKHVFETDQPFLRHPTNSNGQLTTANKHMNEGTTNQNKWRLAQNLAHVSWW